jgi:hypothetical protein
MGFAKSSTNPTVFYRMIHAKLSWRTCAESMPVAEIRILAAVIKLR